MIPVMLIPRRPSSLTHLPCAIILALTGTAAAPTDLSNTPLAGSQTSPASAPSAPAAVQTASAPAQAAPAVAQTTSAPAQSAPAAAPGAPATIQRAPPVQAAAPASSAPTPVQGAPAPSKRAVCLASGDGYLRAHLAGAINATVDWPNSGTHCEGESRNKPPGVRLSFQRLNGKTDLLFVFGITGVREGKPAREAGVNLTIIVQGTSHIFGTLGDSRCTVDSLTQRQIGPAGSYRVEARGFCTQPAHAVRGDGAVLVSTFEFAGPVTYEHEL
jgi:nucleoid-associated protein YgaU